MNYDMRNKLTFNVSSLGSCPFLFSFLLAFQITFSQNILDYQIISDTDESLVIEYTPVLIKVDSIKYGEHTLLSFLFLNTTYEEPRPGEPQIPVRVFPVALRSFDGNSLYVVDVSFVEYHDIKIKPFPNLISEKFSGVEDTISYKKVFVFSDTYSKENYLPEKVAEIGEIGLLRNYIMTTLKVYPLQYNPALGKVRVYSKIKIILRYGQSSFGFSIPDRFDLSIASGFVNHKTSKFWRIQNLNLSKPSESQLAVGQWYRIPITEEGIYKITYTDLRNAGINPSDIDPRTIKIFNNGGGQLPDDIREPRVQGLIENAIYVHGQEDGKFDQEDYILFYGKGTSGWSYDPANKEFSHYIHDYSDVNYYFLTFGGTQGKRIRIVQSLNFPSPFKPEHTIGLYFRDDSKINLTESGRDWFMASVEARAGFNMVSFVTKLEELINGKPIVYKVQVASRSAGRNWFVVREGDDELGRIELGTVILGGISSLLDFYAVKSGPRKFIYNGILRDSRSVLRFYFNWVGEAVAGYIDWFEIIYPRSFRAINDYIAFFSYDTSAIVEYKIFGFSSNDIKLFDVTDFADVKLITGTANAGEFVFQIAQRSGEIMRFIGVGSNGYKKVSRIERIKNTNLRGELEGADWIVITHPDFLPQARRLAEHRYRKDSLKTLVVDINDIYNEFSCGILDPVAIRDFLKYAFDRWVKKPFYVLLFGDGDYDYRNVEVKDKNWIPPYESKEGLQQILTYTSDDFYVLLTPDIYIDMSIGRITVQTQEEAEIVVNKIIEYEHNTDFGLWRSTVLFVADDGLTSGGATDGVIHTFQSETLANYYTPDFIDKRKLYLVAYPTVYTSVGRRKPEASKALVDFINRGVAIVNWIGHGNPYVWAHERVFEIGYTIQNLRNINRLPFIIAATCDFGRFDNPKSQSSTEVLLTLKNAGSVGVLSSTRLVYSSDNAAFNYKFFSELFNGNDDYKTSRVGDAVFRTKQYYASLNDRKFLLFADPALRLIIPRYSTSVDTINGSSTNQVIRLKALGKASFSGRTLKNNAESLITNGKLELVVFDAQKKVSLTDEIGFRFDFVEQGNLLFKGTYSVKNGRFNGEFILPKDIAFSNERAKVLAYFYTGQIDGVGSMTNVVINDIDSVAFVDLKGPEISIYLNNPSFKPGDFVAEESTLFVEIFDESGINISTSSIGRRIEAFLDDDQVGIDLSEYYRSKLDDYRYGEVVYKLPKLSLGKHKIKVKARDIFNNSSVREVEFNVAESDEIKIYNVFNYPNPLVDKTYFTFQKVTLVDDVPVDVEIKIYTISGKLINRIERHGLTGSFIAIEWDGRDIDGDQVANGLYIYKITVRTSDGLRKAESFGRLVVMK